MLEQLDAERLVHDRHRNLLVAATGTGKTVIAALDYRRLCARAGRGSSLLFVAHRKEILAQVAAHLSRGAGDPSFGELTSAATRPERWRHVFASVQSLSAYGLSTVAPDAFDVVVIDEFHHAEAATTAPPRPPGPASCSGLTATPERGGRLDVRDLFGGHVAAELRLWDALGPTCSAPSTTSASPTAPTCGASTGAAAVRRRRALRPSTPATTPAPDHPHSCATRWPTSADEGAGLLRLIAHAEYMARPFNEAGIAARASPADPAGRPRARRSPTCARAGSRRSSPSTSSTRASTCPRQHRALPASDRERHGLPAAARPRAASRPDKPVLTVLDFVGHHRKEFRFDRRGDEHDDDEQEEYSWDHHAAVAGIPPASLRGERRLDLGGASLLRRPRIADDARRSRRTARCRRSRPGHRHQRPAGTEGLPDPAERGAPNGVPPMKTSCRSPSPGRAARVGSRLHERVRRGDRRQRGEAAERGHHDEREERRHRAGDDLGDARTPGRRGPPGAAWAFSRRAASSAPAIDPSAIVEPRMPYSPAPLP